MTERDKRVTPPFPASDLTQEAVQSWGGLIGPAGGGAAGRGNAPALKVQDYDVYIHSNAIMANNVESNLMYQVTQLADVTFLQLPNDLLARMAEWPMHKEVGYIK